VARRPPALAPGKQSGLLPRQPMDLDTDRTAPSAAAVGQGIHRTTPQSCGALLRRRSPPRRLSELRPPLGACAPGPRGSCSIHILTVTKSGWPLSKWQMTGSGLLADCLSWTMDFGSQTANNSIGIRAVLVWTTNCIYFISIQRLKITDNALQVCSSSGLQVAHRHPAVIVFNRNKLQICRR
jgi:hypothetical protein